MGGSGIGSTPSMDPVERMVGEEGGKQDQEQESGIGFDDESPLEPRWRGVFTFHPEQTPEGESGIEHNLELIPVNSVPRKDGKPSGFNWNPDLKCCVLTMYPKLFSKPINLTLITKPSEFFNLSLPPATQQLIKDKLPNSGFAVFRPLDENYSLLVLKPEYLNNTKIIKDFIGFAVDQPTNEDLPQLKSILRNHDIQFSSSFRNIFECAIAVNIKAFQRKLLKVKSKAREPESVSRNPEIRPESSNKDLSSESKIIDLTPQLVSVALTAESNNKDLASESSIKEHISESSRKDFKAESALKKPEFNEHTNNETRIEQEHCLQPDHTLLPTLSRLRDSTLLQDAPHKPDQTQIPDKTLSLDQTLEPDPTMISDPTLLPGATPIPDQTLLPDPTLRKDLFHEKSLLEYPITSPDPSSARIIKSPRSNVLEKSSTAILPQPEPVPELEPSKLSTSEKAVIAVSLGQECSDLNSKDLSEPPIDKLSTSEKALVLSTSLGLEKENATKRPDAATTDESSISNDKFELPIDFPPPASVQVLKVVPAKLRRKQNNVSTDSESSEFVPVKEKTENPEVPDFEPPPSVQIVGEVMHNPEYEEPPVSPPRCELNINLVETNSQQEEVVTNQDPTVPPLYEPVLIDTLRTRQLNKQNRIIRKPQTNLHASQNPLQESESNSQFFPPAHEQPQYQQNSQFNPNIAPFANFHSQPYSQSSRLPHPYLNPIRPPYPQPYFHQQGNAFSQQHPQSYPQQFRQPQPLPELRSHLLSHSNRQVQPKSQNQQHPQPQCLPNRPHLQAQSTPYHQSHLQPHPYSQVQQHRHPHQASQQPLSHLQVPHQPQPQPYLQFQPQAQPHSQHQSYLLTNQAQQQQIPARPVNRRPSHPPPPPYLHAQQQGQGHPYSHHQSDPNLQELLQSQPIPHQQSHQYLPHSEHYSTMASTSHSVQTIHSSVPSQSSGFYQHLNEAFPPQQSVNQMSAPGVGGRMNNQLGYPHKSSIRNPAPPPLPQPQPQQQQQQQNFSSVQQQSWGNLPIVEGQIQGIQAQVPVPTRGGQYQSGGYTAQHPTPIPNYSSPVSSKPLVSIAQSSPGTLQTMKSHEFSDEERMRISIEQQTRQRELQQLQANKGLHRQPPTISQADHCTETQATCRLLWPESVEVLEPLSILKSTAINLELAKETVRDLYQCCVNLTQSKINALLNLLKGEISVTQFSLELMANSTSFKYFHWFRFYLKTGNVSLTEIHETFKCIIRFIKFPANPFICLSKDPNPFKQILEICMKRNPTVETWKLLLQLLVWNLTLKDFVEKMSSDISISEGLEQKFTSFLLFLHDLEDKETYLKDLVSFLNKLSLGDKGSMDVKNNMKESDYILVKGNNPVNPTQPENISINNLIAPSTSSSSVEETRRLSLDNPGSQDEAEGLNREYILNTPPPINPVPELRMIIDNSDLVSHSKRTSIPPHIQEQTSDINLGGNVPVLESPDSTWNPVRKPLLQNPKPANIKHQEEKKADIRIKAGRGRGQKTGRQGLILESKGKRGRGRSKLPTTADSNNTNFQIPTTIINNTKRPIQPRPVPELLKVGKPTSDSSEKISSDSHHFTEIIKRRVNQARNDLQDYHNFRACFIQFINNEISGDELISKASWNGISKTYLEEKKSSLQSALFSTTPWIFPHDIFNDPEVKVDHTSRKLYICIVNSIQQTPTEFRPRPITSAENLECSSFFRIKVIDNNIPQEYTCIVAEQSTILIFLRQSELPDPEFAVSMTRYREDTAKLFIQNKKKVNDDIVHAKIVQDLTGFKQDFLNVLNISSRDCIITLENFVWLFSEYERTCGHALMMQYVTSPPEQVRIKLISICSELDEDILLNVFKLQNKTTRLGFTLIVFAKRIILVHDPDMILKDFGYGKGFELKTHLRNGTLFVTVGSLSLALTVEVVAEESRFLELLEKNQGLAVDRESKLIDYLKDCEPKVEPLKFSERSVDCIARAYIKANKKPIPVIMIYLTPIKACTRRAQILGYNCQNSILKFDVIIVKNDEGMKFLAEKGALLLEENIHLIKTTDLSILRYMYKPSSCLFLQIKTDIFQPRNIIDGDLCTSQVRLEQLRPREEFIMFWEPIAAKETFVIPKNFPDISHPEFLKTIISSPLSSSSGSPRQSNSAKNSPTQLLSSKSPKKESNGFPNSTAGSPSLRPGNSPRKSPKQGTSPKGGSSQKVSLRGETIESLRKALHEEQKKILNSVPQNRKLDLMDKGLPTVPDNIPTPIQSLSQGNIELWFPEESSEKSPIISGQPEQCTNLSSTVSTIPITEPQSSISYTQQRCSQSPQTLPVTDCIQETQDLAAELGIRLESPSDMKKGQNIVLRRVDENNPFKFRLSKSDLNLSTNSLLDSPSSSEPEDDAAFHNDSAVVDDSGLHNDSATEDDSALHNDSATVDDSALHNDSDIEDHSALPSDLATEDVSGLRKDAVSVEDAPTNDSSDTSEQIALEKSPFMHASLPAKDISMSECAISNVSSKNPEIPIKSTTGPPLNFRKEDLKRKSNVLEETNTSVDDNKENKSSRRKKRRGEDPLEEKKPPPVDLLDDQEVIDLYKDDEDRLQDIPGVDEYVSRKIIKFRADYKDFYEFKSGLRSFILVCSDIQHEVGGLARGDLLLAYKGKLFDSETLGKSVKSLRDKLHKDISIQPLKGIPVSVQIMLLGVFSHKEFKDYYLKNQRKDKITKPWVLAVSKLIENSGLRIDEFFSKIQTRRSNNKTEKKKSSKEKKSTEERKERKRKSSEKENEKRENKRVKINDDISSSLSAKSSANSGTTEKVLNQSKTSGENQHSEEPKRKQPINIMLEKKILDGNILPGTSNSVNPDNSIKPSEKSLEPSRWRSNEIILTEPGSDDSHDFYNSDDNENTANYENSDQECEIRTNGKASSLSNMSGREGIFQEDNFQSLPECSPNSSNNPAKKSSVKFEISSTRPNIPGILKKSTQGSVSKPETLSNPVPGVSKVSSWLTNEMADVGDHYPEIQDQTPALTSRKLNFWGYNVNMREAYVSVARLKKFSNPNPTSIRPNQTYTVERTCEPPPPSQFPSYEQLLLEKSIRDESRMKEQGWRSNTFCNLCNIQFQTDSEIITHVEQQHGASSPSYSSVFSCSQCSNTYSSQHRANLHFLKKHFTK